MNARARPQRSPGLLLLALLSLLATAAAVVLEYRLEARRIAPDTYVFIGAAEDFSTRNGGNIANAAFIVTGDGVVVIDTGTTRKFGETMRRTIAGITRQPIREVWNTHHHPDHFLGNQAFADVPIGALAATAQAMRDEGQAFAGNVYRLAGDWAKGTEPHVADRKLSAGIREIGGHRFRLMALQGHTAADLAILDETTGVLFAGDLVFHDRAPATPHAQIGQWLRSLDELAALPFKILVPGHGVPTNDARPIAQTRAWLNWLDTTLRDAAERGLDPTEILERPLPADLASMPLARHELSRSLAHLYGKLESSALGRGSK